MSQLYALVFKIDKAIIGERANDNQKKDNEKKTI